jgi:hypothetical protein
MVGSSPFQYPSVDLGVFVGHRCGIESIRIAFASVT